MYVLAIVIGMSQGLCCQPAPARKLALGASQNPRTTGKYGSTNLASNCPPGLSNAKCREKKRPRTREITVFFIRVGESGPGLRFYKSSKSCS